MPERLKQLERWVGKTLGDDAFELTPASADASFRRYFRVHWDGGTRIVMDAPPDKEALEPFVSLARQLRLIGLNVPEVIAEDHDAGFLLLSDLGTELYLDALDEGSVDRLYGDALGALAALQACGPEHLPPYDRERLMGEMGLFPAWFLERHLGLELSRSERSMLDGMFERLTVSALEQPRVAVHRDYHSRNLMVSEHNPGILDFQDAVLGPVTYDPVSLLRDCYVAWPRERVEAWAVGYHDLAVQSGILYEPQEERFLLWFDLMGVQRHLKAIGIFARLNHRDGKPGYLADIPRTLGYIREIAGRRTELASMGDFIDNRILPAMGRG